MRFRVGQPQGPGGGGTGTIVLPVDPPPMIDISSLFRLAEFRTSATTAAPFAPVSINWKIEPIGTAQFDDYQFRLVVFGHLALNGIEEQDSVSFPLMANTRATIAARRKGSGGWMTFEQALTISLDDSTCQIIDHYGPGIDAAVFGELDTVLDNTKELRFRRERVPVDPRNPNGPAKTIVLEAAEPDWTLRRIRYEFPLEIVIANFFNADLDIRMDLSFRLTHDATGADLEILVEFTVKSSFSTGEHIISAILPSGTSTYAISETLNRVLPLLFDCKKAEIEAQIGDQVIENRVKAALADLHDGRIFAVRIVPRGPTGVDNHVHVVVCSASEAPPEDDDGPVVRGAQQPS